MVTSSITADHTMQTNFHKQFNDVIKEDDDDDDDDDWHDSGESDMCICES